MQNTKFYQIISEKELTSVNINSPIAILTADITNNKALIKKLINNCPKTEFWLATSTMKREIILLANNLGFKNILTPPINEDVIKDYFNKNCAETLSPPTSKNFEPLIGSKIMIVDDNIMNIQLLEEVLKGLEIHLDTFTKPQITLDKINTEEYDLFLLDILMPDMSGFELASFIKQSKLNKSKPIVFMSALGDKEYKITGFESGASHYIEKPYDIKLVRHQIYNILREEYEKKQLHKSNAWSWKT